MPRIYNFSAGPATLPEAVLMQVRDELLDWHDMGMSVMEISHRSKEFEAVAEAAEADLRELLKIPAQYKVLFLQGGARSQFAMVPMNLLRGKESADYVDTGVWSSIALAEASRYCQVNVATSDKKQGYTTIAPRAEWKCNSAAAYCHYVDNETVNGVEFPTVPDVGNIPLVSDMSSNILTRPIDISRYALIYAGAQKNIGPAGLTVVIVHEDMIGKPLPFTPTMFNYKVHADENSLYNTPPTFAWYFAGLVFKWLKQQGGVAEMAKLAERKSSKLYRFIDNTSFYYNSIDPKYRSRVNVVFKLSNELLNERFLQDALAAGLAGLKGHKLVGGMRASLFNAFPESGVDVLIDFMTDFARRHG